jgi:hypothetical protein
MVGTFIGPWGISASAKSEDDEGLVAHWHLDESGGDVVHDSSDNGNHGKVYGAQWDGGISQGALRFDGQDDYVEVPSSSSLDLTTAVTIELWVNQDSLDSVDRTLVAKGPPSSDVSNYDLRVSQGRVRLCFRNPGISWYAYSTTDPVITAGEWTHIVLVHVWGDATSTKIYVDAVEKPGTWIVGDGDTPAVPNPHPLYISGTGKLKAFNGLIDEVRIYNRPLTAEEVRSHYEAVVGISETGAGSTEAEDAASASWVFLPVLIAIAVALAALFVAISRRRREEA